MEFLHLKLILLSLLHCKPLLVTNVIKLIAIVLLSSCYLRITLYSSPDFISSKNTPTQQGFYCFFRGEENFSLKISEGTTSLLSFTASISDILEIPHKRWNV